VGVGWLCVSACPVGKNERIGVPLCDNIFFGRDLGQDKKSSVFSVVKLGFREWGLGFSKKINKGVVG